MVWKGVKLEIRQDKIIKKVITTFSDKLEHIKAPKTPMQFHQQITPLDNPNAFEKNYTIPLPNCYHLPTTTLTTTITVMFTIQQNLDYGFVFALVI